VVSGCSGVMLWIASCRNKLVAEEQKKQTMSKDRMSGERR
jgi:hypothetical protein